MSYKNITFLTALKGININFGSIWQQSDTFYDVNH